MGTSGNPAKKTAAKKTAAKKAPAKKTAAKKSATSRAKAAAPSTVSSPSDFKQRVVGQLLPLPSGLTVRARRVELRTFINQGTVPNPLMAVVQEALDKGKEVDVEKTFGMENGEIDLDMVNEMYEMVDRVVISSIVEPEIHALPTQEDVDSTDGVESIEELKDESLVYTDEVDDEDKMFIYQWAVGGTDDVVRFREEARADMDAMEKGRNAKSTS